MDNRKLKILIIGDNLINSTNFSETIHKALPGTETYIAGNVLEGLKLAKTNEPDVILIDVSMSKTDSLKISQILKKEEALQATPMLFITDLEDDREFRLEALKAGVEGFLIKPIEDTILISQLRSMVKIKERNLLIKNQKKQLELLVKSRTRELKEDISERKTLEIELKKSKDLFRSYIEKAPIGILVIDALGRYIDVNEKACEMMGHTQKELLNRSVVDNLATDQVEKGLEAFNELVEEGVVFGEYIVTRKDKEEFWINLYATKINDNCFLSFYIDISERKLTEEKLKMASKNQQMLGEELAEKNEELAEKNEELILRLQQTIDTISKIGEMKDVYTAGHQKNVALLSCAIGREMELSEDSIENISTGALIHDIGKINIPSGILNKPGKISNLEYQILQSHVDNSYEIVKEIDFPKEVIKMIYQHHERLDGSGYPQKLRGEDIIIESRILAVADVVEAMMSHRPYRPALGIDAAIEEILMYKGIKYDSEVVDICVKLFRECGFKFPEE